MEFLIESKSSGNKYMVQAYFDGDKPVIICNCPAGERETYCKHRITLIEGDDSAVIEASHSIEDLQAALQGSELILAMEELTEQEKAVKAAQAKVRNAKKKVERLMHGY